MKIYFYHNNSYTLIIFYTSINDNSISINDNSNI